MNKFLKLLLMVAVLAATSFSWADNANKGVGENCKDNPKMEGCAQKPTSLADRCPNITGQLHEDVVQEPQTKVVPTNSPVTGR